MKLQKTLKVKLGKLSNNKTTILDSVINKNTKAINFCLNKAKKGKLITHHLVYKDLRKLNLPATIIHGARAKSVEIIKSYKKAKKRLENKKSWKKKNKKVKFPKLENGAVRYDNQIVKLRKTDNKLYKYFISLLYKAGTQRRTDNRIELPLIINSEYQTNIIQQIGEEFKLGSTELVKKGDDFFVHISYSKEINIPEPDETFIPIGIDIGIRNLAVVSVAQQQPKFFSGKRVSWKRNFFFEQRRKLQNNFALEEIKRQRGRETKYLDVVNHNIAKQIIEIAKRTEKPVIVMEDLTNITEYKIWTKRGNRKLSNWAFRRLQNAIQQKALWEGIPVEYIDPKGTTHICSKCGTINKRKQDRYKCRNCGYEIHSDLNATFNIRQFWLDKFQPEQVTINIASNDTIPEPQTEKDSSLLSTNSEDNKQSVRNFKRRRSQFLTSLKTCVSLRKFYDNNLSEHGMEK